MVSKPKLNDCITCHLPTEYVDVIKNLSLQENISASEWVRNIVKAELDNQCLQLQFKAQAFEKLANYKIHENGENAND